jgi:hypothetical protein
MLHDNSEYAMNRFMRDIPEHATQPRLTRDERPAQMHAIYNAFAVR